MTKKQVGEIISTGRDRLAVETSELEERVQNIREYAVSGTRPTVRVLARLESALCDLRIAIQILEEEYGAWQGETGLRRPEDAQYVAPPPSMEEYNSAAGRVKND